MTNFTHQKILAMLEGCSSTKPMEFDALLKKTGLLPETLAMVLAQMQHSIPATINCCILTKAGKSRTVYWPTSARKPIEDYGRHYPAQATTEKVSAAPVLNTISVKAAYELISKNPGLPQEDLVSRLRGRGVSLATCYNAIRYLINKNYIRRDGPKRNYKLYLAGVAAA